MTASPDPAGLRPAVILVDSRPERRGPILGVIELALGDGTVAAVGSAGEAVAAVERYRAYAAVVEVVPLTEGLAVIAALRAAYPALVIVVCTFHRDLATQRLAEEAGADGYLMKPVSTREMRSALNAGRRTVLVDTAVS